MVEGIADPGQAELIGLVTVTLIPMVSSFLKKNEASKRPHQSKTLFNLGATLLLAVLYGVSQGSIDVPAVLVTWFGTFAAAWFAYKGLLKELIDPNQLVDDLKEWWAARDEFSDYKAQLDAQAAALGTDVVTNDGQPLVLPDNPFSAAVAAPLPSPEMIDPMLLDQEGTD